MQTLVDKQFIPKSNGKGIQGLISNLANNLFGKTIKTKEEYSASTYLAKNTEFTSNLTNDANYFEELLTTIDEIKTLNLTSSSIHMLTEEEKENLAFIPLSEIRALVSLLRENNHQPTPEDLKLTAGLAYLQAGYKATIVTEGLDMAMQITNYEIYHATPTRERILIDGKRSYERYIEMSDLKDKECSDYDTIANHCKMAIASAKANCIEFSHPEKKSYIYI